MPSYFKIRHTIPELIALAIALNNTQLGGWLDLGLLLSIAVTLRFVWNSAIILHGLGHTVAIATADRDLSCINLTNILEHRSIVSIFSSLLPCHYIFIPILSSAYGDGMQEANPIYPYLKLEHREGIKLKALGGIVFNILAAIIFAQYTGFLAQALVTTNLLIALASISDLEAFILGKADDLYCGNFGAIAIRQPEDGQKLLPQRILDIALQMGQETEIRGEQAGGGFVIARQQDDSILTDNKVLFIGKKIVNRKRANLTTSLETAFAPIRNKALASGAKPLSSVMGVWHYRYGTSGAAPSKLETHWHEWMPARDREVWQLEHGKWVGAIANVNQRITHNGDFDSWKVFEREVDYTTLGLWLERVLHTPNATKGDSPKIAGIMDLLVTKGMWYPSVRLAYQETIATSLGNTFGEQKPSVEAVNTAPSDRQLKIWAEIFERIFVRELSNLEEANSYRLNSDLWQFPTSFQRYLVRAFKNHASTQSWSSSEIESFVQYTLEVFLNNDLYRATQIFIQRAKGSFGLVTASTLEESELVLCAKGQPISIGFNRSQDYMVYASEPAAVDRVLLDRPQSYRLDLDRQGGEVAKVSAIDITVYSLVRQRELQASELQNRWVAIANHPYLSYMRFSAIESDPVAQDIDLIPQIFQEIKTDWQNPLSLNRRSADYLIYLMTQKARQFEQRQQLMFKAGSIARKKYISTVDLLIVGEENSLWLGGKFAQDLEIVFPGLNVVTISANQALQELNRGFERLDLDKNSLVLAITQSGQTFSTVRAIEVFDHLSSKGMIGELFIMAGELSGFLNSIQGRGALDLSDREVGYDIGRSSTSPSPKQHRCRTFVNNSGRRQAEPSTVAVAAAGQTLTELLFYLAIQMRDNFANPDPFGMTLNRESLMVLAMMKDDFLDRNVCKIIGIDSRGKPIKSTVKQTLIQKGRYWANHVTETPLAWAIQALYILISVGWTIPFGHTLPLIQTIAQSLFSLVHLPIGLIQLLTPVTILADIAVYIFGAWFWTLAIRYLQNRQLLARMGKRTLVIGDVSWVNQLLQAYVSKLFSLSYGIATIEVHSADPQNHLIHAFGHRLVRGTLIWLGIPDDRSSQQYQKAQDIVTMTGKQAKGVRNLNVGPEIVAVYNKSGCDRQSFERALVLNDNNDSIYLRSTTVEQKEQIEKLRESCFGSFERLLAGYVFFWALAKRVASFPLLKYEHWKSQSRTKTMTTASPVAGFDFDKSIEDKSGEGGFHDRRSSDSTWKGVSFRIKV